MHQIYFLSLPNSVDMTVKGCLKVPPRVNSDINYELWVMMGPCRLISCDKWATPMGSGDYERGCAGIVGPGIRETSVPS